MTADLDSWLGKQQSATDCLTERSIRALAATLGRSGETPCLGDGTHWLLCPPIVPAQDIGEDGHPRKGDFLPPITKPRRMWAAGTLHFHAPLPLDKQIVKVSQIKDISHKTGRSGELVLVDIRHTYRTAETALIDEMQTLVYRDKPQASRLEPIPETDGLADAEVWHYSEHCSADEVMVFRYSALTFNSHKIHYDQPYATAVEGYPGLVVQGPLIATLLMQLTARYKAQHTLRTFSFRALAPAWVGEQLVLRMREVKSGEVLLEAASTAGAVKMRSQACYD